MALARLTAHTTFDRTDGAGILLDGRHDRCYELDLCQTLMLAALLEMSSMEEAIARLAEEIEAQNAELSQALASFCHELEMQGLVRTSEGSGPEIANDALGATKDVALSVTRPASQRPVWERSEEPPWEFFLTGSVEEPDLLQRFPAATNHCCLLRHSYLADLSTLRLWTLASTCRSRARSDSSDEAWASGRF